MTGIPVHQIAKGRLRTDAAIVAEPVGDGDNIITTQVGWVELAISTIGLSQHISRSNDSVDAIDMMVKAIPAIKSVDFAYVPKWELPVGTIVGGRGKDHELRGPNFTCDYCTVVADVRTVPGQTDDTVKALGGELRVESSPGQGTLVEATLPVR